MADPQVPAEAVQQAQVVLQNQAQEAHAPAALAEQAKAPAVPVEQAQAPAQAPVQASEVSLEVCGTFFLSVRCHVFRSGSLVFRFHTLYVVCPIRACFSFPLNILLALFRNVCPLFTGCGGSILFDKLFALLLSFASFPVGCAG